MRTAANKKASDLLLVACFAAAGGRSGSCLSRRGRSCGGGRAMDFCASPPSATRWRLLQRHHGEGGRFAGATAAGLLGLAAAWMVSWLMLGWRMAEGGSGAPPRHRRPEWPVSEEEGELGAGPRPTHHSERWALGAPSGGSQS